MFDYHAAFSRNLGWVTETEQAILRAKRVAIAGLGGVGGSHLLTLTRLGVGQFNIADFDSFEIQNFNRQAGAFVSQLNRPKVDVLTEMACDINPELGVSTFPEGVNDDNLDAFLQGVDLYVDSLDFFALEIRNKVFAACAERGIPSITAAPLGMGSALLVFMPGGMSFEEYFRMKGCDADEQALRFMLGLAPARLQMNYLADDSRVSFSERRGPSTPMACELCAGFAGTYALKILLNRGGVPTAPRGIHFDAYRNKLTRTWRPGGNRNPIQMLGLKIARKRVMDSAPDVVAGKTYKRAVDRILDLARWAPSGDNEQPWRFEIVDDHNVLIHTVDTRDWCVYDLDGSSSQIAVGALLQTIAIAASGEGMRATFSRRPDTPETALQIDLRLEADAGIEPDALLPFVQARVTQRRPFTTRTLAVAQKEAMEQAVGEGYRVVWLEGSKTRWEMAKLLFRSAHIRLTTPEAYEVHRQNIEWGTRFSEDRIPEHAIGVGFPVTRIMRWVLQSWTRVKLFNRFFAGTWPPRLQMDVLPGYCCGAHFVIVADEPVQSVDDFLEGGRAMQRFWLEATRQGLQFQPEMTPLIFSRYVADGLRFTVASDEQDRATKVAADLDSLSGLDASRRVYMGRVGFGTPPTSRSIRPPLSKLLLDQA